MYQDSKSGLVGDVPRYYVYKGLSFPLFDPCLKMIENEIANGGRVTTVPTYAFYGKRALTVGQIREHVGIMIERRLYIPPENALVPLL